MKQKLLAKIHKFFESSFELKYVLSNKIEESPADIFYLETQGLLGNVVAIEHDGVEMDDGILRYFEDLDTIDLEYILDYVIEPIKASEEKTMERTKS